MSNPIFLELEITGI